MNGQESNLSSAFRLDSFYGRGIPPTLVPQIEWTSQTGGQPYSDTSPNEVGKWVYFALVNKI